MVVDVDGRRLRRRARHARVVRRRREPRAMATRGSVAGPQRAFHGAGHRGHHREHRVRRGDLPVDRVSAAGARPRPADGGAGVPWPVGRCRVGRRAVRAPGDQQTAGAGDGGDECSGRGLARGAGGGQQLGCVPARADGVRLHPGVGLCVHDGRDSGRRPPRTGGRGRGGHADRLGHARRGRRRGVRDNAGSAWPQRDVVVRCDRHDPRGVGSAAAAGRRGGAVDLAITQPGERKRRPPLV